MPCLITRDNVCFGSLVYEEYGTDHLKLEMYNATMEDNKGDAEEQNLLDYPQQPLEQTWTTEYPYIAYKHYSPKNNKIVIESLVQDIPVKIVNFPQEWEFVHFVKHTHFPEKNVFEKDHEDKVDIMFLIQNTEDQSKRRLICIKCDPWNKDDQLEFYLFSGVLKRRETQKTHDSEQVQKIEARRYDSDKM